MVWLGCSHQDGDETAPVLLVWLGAVSPCMGRCHPVLHGTAGTVLHRNCCAGPHDASPEVRRGRYHERRCGSPGMERLQFREPSRVAGIELSFFLDLPPY